MIDLEARQKYVYFTIVSRIIMTIVGLPAAIFGLVMMFISMINSKEIIRIPLNISMIFIIIACCFGCIFILVDGFFKKKLRKLAARQFFVIVNTVKIKDNPKVLYIYTCHNDLIEARVLQNIQQTYSNMDVWISDGSSDQVLSEKYKQFAIKNNIHYFKIDGASRSKAHNINTFLEKINPAYDYLLTTDSDEALDSRFVEHALKCFNSDHFNNLGSVSPLNYCYNTQTLYANIGLNLENGLFYKDNYTRTITLGNYSNLISASCLISRKLLEVNNNRFPDSSLEDYYLEYLSLSNGFVGITLPTTPCGQSFDETVWQYFRRIMRVFDWSVKLVKDGAYNVYNEKYGAWYGRLFGYAILLTPSIYLMVIIFPLVLWFITVNFMTLFSNTYFIVMVASAIVMGIAAIITALIDTGSKTVGNKYVGLAGLFSFFYGLAFIPQLTVHWFNALFRSKYSGFSATRGSKVKKQPIIKYWIVFIVSIVTIAIWVTCYALFIKFALDWKLLSFFYVTIVLLIVMLCSLSFIVLDAFGKKIINKDYDESKFIYPKEFYLFKKEEAKALEIINRKEQCND